MCVNQLTFSMLHRKKNFWIYCSKLSFFHLHVSGSLDLGQHEKLLKPQVPLDNHSPVCPPAPSGMLRAFYFLLNKLPEHLLNYFANLSRLLNYLPDSDSA